MILVIATARTGATSLLNDLAAKHNYINLKEGLNPYARTDEELERNLALVLEDNANVVLKVFTDHTLENHPNVLDDLCTTAEKIYYTTRNDFSKQCQSFYISERRNKWHQWQASDELEHDEEIEIDGDYYMTFVKWIAQDWKQLSDCYDKYPGEIIKLEDRNEPYTFNKSYNIIGKWPDISDYVNEFEKFKKTSRLF